MGKTKKERRNTERHQRARATRSPQVCALSAGTAPQRHQRVELVSPSTHLPAYGSTQRGDDG
eukprot:8632401-Heterocapsa_arctica.AAC.1